MNMPDFLEPRERSHAAKAGKKNSQDSAVALRMIVVLLGLAILSSFFVIVSAGERGVLIKFGAVQSIVLNEGIHPLLPIVYTVEKLSVRVRRSKGEFSARRSGSSTVTQSEFDTGIIAATGDREMERNLTDRRGRVWRQPLRLARTPAS